MSRLPSSKSRKTAEYPVNATARDRFILERRGPRPPQDAWRYQHLIVEDERTAEGSIAQVATVFLTGRECPWRCAMCDLWQYTTATDTPPGAIPGQIAAARLVLEDQKDLVAHMKLYNAANFFDPRAVPESDYDRIAATLAGLDRVIVESHPALIGSRVDRFLEALDRHRVASSAPVQLEVAMGLETAHPIALERLNKRMTVDEFTVAAARLKRCGVALRVFLLISPPFVEPDEQDAWLLRSIDVAFSCGATAVSLIPTRPGNGAIETLAADGLFRSPELEDIERSVDLAQMHVHDGRVFVDLWDLKRFARCLHCFDVRRARLHAINLEQRSAALPVCPHCCCGVPA
jgi:radical SAM enzyme (TIGR01210 family)